MPSGAKLVAALPHHSPQVVEAGLGEVVRNDLGRFGAGVKQRLGRAAVKRLATALSKLS